MEMVIAICVLIAGIGVIFICASKVVKKNDYSLPINSSVSMPGEISQNTQSVNINNFNTEIPKKASRMFNRNIDPDQSTSGYAQRLFFVASVVRIVSLITGIIIFMAVMAVTAVSFVMQGSKYIGTEITGAVVGVVLSFFTAFSGYISATIMESVASITESQYQQRVIQKEIVECLANINKTLADRNLKEE